MKSLKDTLITESEFKFKRGELEEVTVIKTKLNEAFIYIWDEIGLNMTSTEFHELVADVLENYDVRKEIPWVKK
jgi:hypothetical protein